MDDQAVAIKVENLYKDFILPKEKTNALKQKIVNPFASKDKTVQHALKDINLEVKEGEFFGIVGKNGSGKSTLLKILAGIYQPTKGHVQLNGKLMPFIELGVGFNPELTGRENVFMSGALLGFSEPEMSARYDDIVKFSEIEEFMDQKLKNYSSGMQVRLAFSIAIQSEADVLLIDEVLAVGDTAFQRKCYDYFKQLKREKKTIVFVTHDMDAVRQYCDRAMLINDAKAVFSGSVNTAAAKYEQLNQRKVDAKSVMKGSSKRIGDGSAHIKNLKATNSLTQNQKDIQISFEVDFHKDLEGVLIGFDLKDQAGRPLLGTNNLLQGKPIKNISKGGKLKLNWTLQHILNDGIYDMTITVAHDGGTADSWLQEKFITSSRVPTTGFVIAPPVKLTIENKN